MTVLNQLETFVTEVAKEAVKDGHTLAVDAGHFITNQGVRLGQVGKHLVGRTWEVTDEEFEVIKEEIFALLKEDGVKVGGKKAKKAEPEVEVKKVEPEVKKTEEDAK